MSLQSERVRKLAEQFVTEQGILLRSEMTTFEAVAQRMAELPDQVREEVERIARNPGDDPEPEQALLGQPRLDP